MTKYTKNPVTIEAVKLSDHHHRRTRNLGHTTMILPPKWYMDARHKGIIVYYDDGTATIETLEGDHKACKDDYIIQGIKGELYPCKPDIFEATYTKNDLQNNVNDTSKEDPISQFFTYAHLPEFLQNISKPFSDLHDNIITNIPMNPERDVALRKLLEAKDATVRAKLYK